MDQHLPPTDAPGDEPAKDASLLEEEAIHWVVRLTSGDTTAEERAAFKRWRAQSTEHEAALIMARQLWVGLEAAIPSQTARSVQRRATIARWRPLAMAASLLIAVALVFQGFHVWRYDDVTTTGERRTIALEDGSSIELNSGSALDIDFSARERRVDLARGEAFFDVAHNPERPFRVRTPEGEVRVLGTAFSVNRDAQDSVLVTVVRGRVEVDDGRDPVVLTVGQQLRFRAGHHAQVSAVDPYTELAWRRGRLIIEDQSLNQIVGQLQRYYPGRIVMTTNSSMGQRHLNAVIDLDHIDDWLLALGESQPVRVQRLGPVVLIR